MQTDLSAINQQAIKDYRGKTFLVVGAARSGVAATELLLAIGAFVVLNDSKKECELASLPDTLNHPNCKKCFGQPAEPLFSGCDYLLISPGIPCDAPLVKKAGEMGLQVIGELEFAASCATQEIIAVSGTNGKTTTVSLLGEIFNQSGRNASVSGNIGYPLSAAVLRAKADDVLIVEVSSFQMETAQNFHPRAAALLNITPDHLDRHKTMECYVSLKKKMFQNMTENDVAILNYDDPMLREMAGDLPAPVTWFSRCGKAKTGVVLHNDKLAFLQNGEYHALCEAKALQIPGNHNIENALAAAAVAVRSGVPLSVISKALQSFKGVEHRIEFTAKINGVRYLNDSKGTNPDSTIKAVESMAAPTVLIAGGYDKQVSFASLAETISGSGLVTHAILFGQTKEKIASALRDKGFDQISFVQDLEKAVSLAQELAQPGGNVLFSPACASFGMFSDYEQRGRLFKSYVRSLKEEV
ncbi:MAG: UDP-N-acetylmuramoyl-L-alanine--D-glutamate ligase [Bacillota bacterium]|nr:UDP-N-acetylmuramoyl-L-alanine--D-glutamate ligase [Bacillota bacterium]